MGIPYSRQINAAFDQVTPLVAQGFQVLETTKNIAILLALIQVLTVSLLALILIALVALLITMNPDLEKERKALVTPTMKTLMHQGAFFALAIAGTVIFSSMVGGLYFAIYGRKANPEEEGDEGDEADMEEDEGKDKDGRGSASGKSGEMK